MGGGGSSSSSLKQLLPTKLLDNNTTFLYNGLNITLSADSQWGEFDLNGNINGACNEYNYVWVTRDISFPHFYKVDFGTEVIINKVCFNPINDNVFNNECLVKEYNIQFSSDGINFKNIYSQNQIYNSSKGFIGTVIESPSNNYFEDCINEFDPIETRYIKIIIYNSYDTSHNWTGFCNLRIYSPNSKIFLDKNNYMYGCKGKEQIISYEYDNLLPVITQDITKQLDSEKFEYINKTSLIYNNIKFTTDTLHGSAKFGTSVLFACSDEYSISHVPGYESGIFKNYQPYPHYLQIEFDEVINGVNKFCFNPGAFITGTDGIYTPKSDTVYVKDYNLYYSLDGNKWIKICSKTFLPKSYIDSTYWSVCQTEVVEFDEISLKFFKFEVTSSYFPTSNPRIEEDYSDVKFNQVKLYGLKKIIKKV